MMLIIMICHCGAKYLARESDLSRGWARSCSKSCAAIRRDFGRKAGVRADKAKIKITKDKPSSNRSLTYEEIIKREDLDNSWDSHKTCQ